MLRDYHIGTLDSAALAVLADGEIGEDEGVSPRETFLRAKVWTKAILAEKTTISTDTKIFTFNLEHADQLIGLPIGQHLMMRLRDPVTREAIIRSYTPISEGSTRGKLEVLVKVYYNRPERKGGRMTQALDAIPLGHAVDFKGPVGKFEYLGRGLCAVSGTRRRVRRFVMVCAGSGITPILQVLRAVMDDRDDDTFCLVLDGNRIRDDILCKANLDAMAARNTHKCRLLYMLSRPEDDWPGLRGRMSKELFEREVGPCTGIDGEDLVLVCGPEALEKSVQAILMHMGWRNEDVLFF